MWDKDIDKFSISDSFYFKWLFKKNSFIIFHVWIWNKQSRLIGNEEIILFDAARERGSFSLSRVGSGMGAREQNKLARLLAQFSGKDYLCADWKTGNLYDPARRRGQSDRNLNYLIRRRNDDLHEHCGPALLCLGR